MLVCCLDDVHMTLFLRTRARLPAMSEDSAEPSGERRETVQTWDQDDWSAMIMAIKMQSAGWLD